MNLVMEKMEHQVIGCRTNEYRIKIIRCTCTSAAAHAVDGYRPANVRYSTIFTSEAGLSRRFVKKTRIPSGVWSRLYGSFPSALNTYRSNVREARLNTHGQKFDPESLYEAIKFDILQPYLINKY